jgi:serine protease inhibitor
MRPTAPTRANDDTRALAAGFNQFGFALQRCLSRDKNAFVSPLSIAAALAAMHSGARGPTADQMREVLNLPLDDDRLRRGMIGLHEALKPRDKPEEFWSDDEPQTTASEAFRLSLATALWVQEACQLHTDFCEELAEVYDSQFFSDTFADPVAAAARINGWVRDETAGRITELLEPDQITEATRLVLTNAVYFKAAWQNPFEENATQPLPFFLVSGEQVEAPRMHQEERFVYWTDPSLGASAARLLYEQGLSMLIVLPDEGRLDEVSDALSTELLARIQAESTLTLLDLSMPKWETRFGKSLREVLISLGMEDAFTVADFSGITPEQGGLRISEVVHQAWVKVDEEGTEAAAATAVLVMVGSAEVPNQLPTPFQVDRPFFFFIQDHATGAVLFQGRIMDPRSSLPT